MIAMLHQNLRPYACFLVIIFITAIALAQQGEPFVVRASSDGLTTRDIGVQPVNLQDFEKLIKSSDRYPNFERQAFVRVRIKVSECGDYLRHEVLAYRDPDFLQVVENHIESLRFNPYLENGQPKEKWVHLPLELEHKQ